MMIFFENTFIVKEHRDGGQKSRFRCGLLLSGCVSGVDAAAALHASKMTKLQLLNAYLTERLTVVVKEILDVVEDTVTEYREETARTKRENESLRRQLRDILLLEADTEWLSKGRARCGGAAIQTAIKYTSGLNFQSELTLNIG